MKNSDEGMSLTNGFNLGPNGIRNTLKTRCLKIRNPWPRLGLYDQTGDKSNFNVLTAPGHKKSVELGLL